MNRDESMSRIGGHSGQTVMLREITQTRVDMEDLQRQLASGKVAKTYGGLGSDRTMALALQQEKTQIETFRDTITLASTRLDVMDAAVGQMRESASATRGQLLIGGFEPDSGGQTVAQKQARARLADTVDLLNTEIGGRQLFAGTKTDNPPVLPPAELLDGVGSKAGFRQIMSERREADLGVNSNGRLGLEASDPQSLVLSEDVAGSPFGFKIDTVRSSLSGVDIAGPAGDPATIGFDFTAVLPQDGEEITLTLNLPDGTKTELTLTARLGGEPDAGEFSIGTDAASTASSFQNALTSRLQTEAGSTLVGASMQAAADDFFTSGSNPPQRVNGPPFASATGLRDATNEDTVAWYTGDRSDTPARETALARIDENSVVAYGARADEEAFGTLIKQYAILSSATFPGDSEQGLEQYSAMTDRVGAQLSGSIKSESIDRVIGELAISKGRLQEADDRYITSGNMITGFLSDIETADVAEVAASLLSKQTQLQASYQVTSMLSRLTLANFL